MVFAVLLTIVLEDQYQTDTRVESGSDSEEVSE